MLTNDAIIIRILLLCVVAREYVFFSRTDTAFCVIQVRLLIHCAPPLKAPQVGTTPITVNV